MRWMDAMEDRMRKRTTVAGWKRKMDKTMAMAIGQTKTGKVCTVPMLKEDFRDNWLFLKTSSNKTFVTIDFSSKRLRRGLS